MREIPELQVLCLRTVGSQACSAEDTFAKLENGDPSTASRLLRSFHERSSSSNSAADNSDGNSTINNIPLHRKPCIGPGSSRRINPNDIDLNHPIIGCRVKSTGDDDEKPARFRPLIMQYGNPALDVLQTYIDSLVELGRMDDGRLGVHFFEEWKINVQIPDAKKNPQKAAATPAATTTPQSRPKKRRRGGGSSSRGQSPQPVPVTALGSLSLHNCTIASETIDAMVKSGMGPHVRVLDMTGVRGISDQFAAKLFKTTPNLQRLSLKNCRKLTYKTCGSIRQSNKKLQSLDVGGCFNIVTEDILDIVPDLPVLNELHASGLQWKDHSIERLVQIRDTWKSLSFGFSIDLSQKPLRESLIQLGDSIQSLSLPFCESVVDNTLLGILGRNLPLLRFLDLRGNPALYTITGFYDGRASANLPVTSLTVLARYTGITKASVEETCRVHPLQTTDDLLTVILDGSGMGAGIEREDE